MAEYCRKWPNDQVDWMNTECKDFPIPDPIIRLELVQHSKKTGNT